jgi:hypothetical protein
MTRARNLHPDVEKSWLPYEVGHSGLATLFTMSKCESQEMSVLVKEMFTMPHEGAMPVSAMVYGNVSSFRKLGPGFGLS